jgi:hypothetical protein
MLGNVGGRYKSFLLFENGHKLVRINGMGKKRKPASTRTATPVDGDIATATRSAYDQGVEANKAQNKRVLDSLGAPQLERAPKRCGPAF